MPKKRKIPAPPCPDPEKYVLVQTKERDYWRRKRGTVKKATLNAVLKQNTRNFKKLSPVGSSIAAHLEPFMAGLDKGRLMARITGKLVKYFNVHKRLGLEALHDFDVQPDYRLERILSHDSKLQFKNKHLLVDIGIIHCRLLHTSTTVTDYYLDVILLQNSPDDASRFSIQSETSGLFPIDTVHKKPVSFLFKRPRAGAQWIIVLKFKTMQRQYLSSSFKLNGMKVIATSTALG